MNELTPMSIINMILHRLWAVILAAVVCAVGTFAYCRFLADPVYQATISLAVTNGTIIKDDDGSTAETGNQNNTVNFNDLSASVYVAKNCVDILKSSSIYKDLSAAINNQYSYKMLKKGFSVNLRNEEKIFIDISFKSTSYNETIKIVNAFADLSAVNIKKIIPSATVVVMDYADTAPQTSPRTTNNALLAAVVGALLASGIIVVLNLFDRTIKGEEDFKARFDIPILGCVPDFDSVMGNSTHTRSKAKSVKGGMING